VFFSSQNRSEVKQPKGWMPTKLGRLDIDHWLSYHNFLEVPGLPRSYTPSRYFNRLAIVRACLLWWQDWPVNFLPSECIKGTYPSMNAFSYNFSRIWAKYQDIKEPTPIPRQTFDLTSLEERFESLRDRSCFYLLPLRSYISHQKSYSLLDLLATFTRQYLPLF
jgi:hypothetical protein